MRQNNRHKRFEHFNHDLWKEFEQFFGQIGSDIKNRTWHSSELFLLSITSSLTQICSKTMLSIEKEINFLRTFQQSGKELDERNIHELEHKIIAARDIENVLLNTSNPQFVLQLRIFRRKLRRCTDNFITKSIKSHQRRKTETTSAENMNRNLY